MKTVSRDELLIKIMSATQDATQERLEQIKNAIDGVLLGTGNTTPAYVSDMRLLNISQAAKELNLSRSTVIRMAQAGTLERIEIRPNCWRFRRQAMGE